MSASKKIEYSSSSSFRTTSTMVDHSETDGDFYASRRSAFFRFQHLADRLSTWRASVLRRTQSLHGIDGGRALGRRQRRGLSQQDDENSSHSQHERVDRVDVE